MQDARPDMLGGPSIINISSVLSKNAETYQVPTLLTHVVIGEWSGMQDKISHSSNSSGWLNLGPPHVTFGIYPAVLNVICACPSDQIRI